MGFSKMLELLQQKNKGYIILANAGAFYLARGKDAVKLNDRRRGKHNNNTETYKSIKWRDK